MTNKCGECNLCCNIPEIKALDKNPNILCDRYCQINTQCSAYDDRPEECRLFECAWLQAGGHLDLRPDNCKIMFEKLSQRLFFGSQHPDYEMTVVGKQQIESFNKQGFSVIVKNNNELSYSLAEGHTIKQIRKDYDKYIVR